MKKLRLNDSNLRKAQQSDEDSSSHLPLRVQVLKYKVSMEHKLPMSNKKEGPNTSIYRNEGLKAITFIRMF